MSRTWIWAILLTFCISVDPAWSLDSRLGSTEFNEASRASPRYSSIPGEWIDFDASPVMPWVSRSGPSDWASIIDDGIEPPIYFGVRLTGPAPYFRNSESSFAPASNAKLFTAAAALHYLGPRFTIETRLDWREYSVPGQITGLTLIGGGDPTWGMVEFGETLTTRLDQMAQTLFNQGIRTVVGPVEIQSADPRWDVLTYPQGWSPDDRTACYGALAQSFNLDINCAEFVITGESAGHWADPALNAPVAVQLVRGAASSVYAVAFDLPGIVAGGFRIRGTFAPSNGPVSLILPVHHSKTRVLNHFKNALVRTGIVLLPQAGSDLKPLPGVQSLRFQSPPLSEMLKPFLKLSLNYMGDALFKILGQRLGDPGDDLITAGQSLMREYVAGIEAGRFRNDVVLYDGSGVSRASTVTPTAILSLLELMLTGADFSVLWEALPIAGIDGTLEGRMKGTAAHGVLRAKTGTLSGVYNLSGYVPKYGPQGTVQSYVPFVMLSRTRSEFKARARGAQDRVGAILSYKVSHD